MEQIQKKLQKGKSIETIAYELEESQEIIQALIEQMNLQQINRVEGEPD